MAKNQIVRGVSNLSTGKKPGLLIDLDGTIFYGNRLLDGASDFLEWISNRGWPYLCVTNNSSRTQQQVANKFKQVGVEVSPKRIMTSSQATAQYLRDHAKQGARVYVIGEEGLNQALTDSGFQLTEDAPEIVVVGLDRLFDMYKLAKAVNAIRRGATFIATNSDPTLLTEDGIVPGTGSLVAMVESETGRAPISLGKPSHWFFGLATQKLRMHSGKIVMIGDNIETDIKGAKSFGLGTALVMTGTTTHAQLSVSDIKPDYVADNLKALIKMWS